MAIYSGQGKIIHAAPWNPCVIKEPLLGGQPSDLSVLPIIATRRINMNQE